MAQPDHTSTESRDGEQRNLVTRYAERCGQLPPGKPDRETLGQLVRLERAARRAMRENDRRALTR